MHGLRFPSFRAAFALLPYGSLSPLVLPLPLAFRALSAVIFLTAFSATSPLRCPQVVSLLRIPTIAGPPTRAAAFSTIHCPIEDGDEDFRNSNLNTSIAQESSLFL
jgi:hypothetical protein